MSGEGNQGWPERWCYAWSSSSSCCELIISKKYLDLNFKGAFCLILCSKLWMMSRNVFFWGGGDDRRQEVNCCHLAAVVRHYSRTSHEPQAEEKLHKHGQMSEGLLWTSVYYVRKKISIFHLSFFVFDLSNIINSLLLDRNHPYYYMRWRW